MAKKDEYYGAPDEVLEQLSEEDLERLANESHQKAIRDYNSQMHSAERRGFEKRVRLGRLCIIVRKLLEKGCSIKEISELLDEKPEDIELIVREIEGK